MLVWKLVYIGLLDFNLIELFKNLLNVTSYNYATFGCFR